MKTIVKLLIIFVLSNTLQNTKAQMEWIDFGNGSDGQEPQIDLYSNTSLSANFYGIYRHFISANDTIYDVLKLPGNCSKSEDFGFPLLEAKTCYIEVTTDTPSISINSLDFYIIDNFYLWPAQNEKELWDESPISPFEKNDSIYSLNKFYPENIVKIRYPKIIRGHKIASIAFFPVQFNPVTKQLKVYRNIDITIHGAGSERSTYDNAHFDSFLNNILINYIPESDPDFNIDLMIITPTEYESALLPFKE